MKMLRTLRALLPIAALTISWTLMAQGQGGNQAQAVVSFSSDPLVQSLKWRNIGNANLIGRISAIDALENDFAHVVVGSASGGVFKSTNAGVTWTPIFDNYGAASIGDVKINQKNPDIIWVGTGEECGRNSAAWGDGIYKSTDGGKTFTNVGLKDTYNIGSITLHPTDPNIVYVAAIGNIWGKVGDRGFFKTIDGGKTWTKLTNNLPDDGWTGAIEARMDPTNPNVLYVGFWERKRTAWRLDSGGPNGGIWKTTDGGKTFRKLTKGLPPGKTGKIGLAIARSNPKVVMAHVEAEFQPEPNSPDFRDMTKLGAGIYRSEDGGETWTFVNRYNRRPFYYNHLAISPFNDKETYHYNISFDRTTDGGKTFIPTGRGGGGGGGGGGGQPSTAPQGSGMHCWHAIWLDPHNKKRFWIGSDGGLALTHDDGETYLRFENLNVTQYYDVAADMREPYWVCGGLQDAGSSCGPSATRATAIYTSDWVNTSGGDGYHAAMDPSDNRTVYTESQPATNGGNVTRTDLLTRQGQSIRPRKGVNIVNYDDYITPEIEKRQKELNWGEAPPPPPPGQRGGGRGGFGGGGGGGGRGGQQGATMGAFRWNWSTPFILSEFNPRTLYLGANHLFRTTDRGDTWRIVSPDLTKNITDRILRKSGGLTPDEDPGGGAEFYGTIVTIAESPLAQGEIWVGTDDGNVQVTRNDGATWEEVGKNLPGIAKDLYVSRVEPSHHVRGTAYVSVDGHEAADFKPHVFKTTDYGKTWTAINSNLPEMGPVYVVKEDLKNPNLLFAGTEFAAWYSVDGGRKWGKLNNNMPTVAIHDLMIHPRDNDLIAATHGRGFWIMDDITPLQQLSDKVMSAEAHLFDNRVATQWLRMQPHGTGGTLGFRGENPTRNAVINYHLGSSATGQVRFEISDVTGENKRTLTVPARAGINRLEWTMTFDPSAEQMAAFQQAQQQGRGRQGAAEDPPPTGTAAAGATGGVGRATTVPPPGAGAAPQGGGGQGGGRGGRGGAGPQGDPAGPGEYKVTMTVNGKTYTSRLTVRPDPMLAGS
jgi:photosystem II stability/assembly factor-like uncharacterized protein